MEQGPVVLVGGLTAEDPLTSELDPCDSKAKNHSLRMVLTRYDGFFDALKKGVCNRSSAVGLLNMRR